jgi:hypothetical protein
MARAHFPTFRALGTRLATSVPWRLLAAIAFTIAVIAAVGHFSNHISARSCREDTRRFVLNQLGSAPGPPPIVWVQAQHIAAPSPEPRPGPPPSAAPFELPFIVRVQWGYSRGPRSGAGGLRTYVAFFGLRACISSEPTWIS